MRRIMMMALLGLIGEAVHAESPPKERVVGSGWHWFSDYAYFSSEWTVNASPGCNLEVGFGMKVGGKPRGNIFGFTTYFRGKAYGVGAVHVRRVGGDKHCIVRVELGDVGAIPIYGDPSILKGVADDAAAAARAIDERNDNDFSEPKMNSN
jgi:hypothetical protein